MCSHPIYLSALSPLATTAYLCYALKMDSPVFKEWKNSIHLTLYWITSVSPLRAQPRYQQAKLRPFCSASPACCSYLHEVAQPRDALTPRAPRARQRLFRQRGLVRDSVHPPPKSCTQLLLCRASRQSPETATRLSNRREGHAGLKARWGYLWIVLQEGGQVQQLPVSHWCPSSSRICCRAPRVLGSLQCSRVLPSPDSQRWMLSQRPRDFTEEHYLFLHCSHGFILTT